MLLHGVPDHRQPESGATAAAHALAGIEGFEDVLKIGNGNATTIVVHLKAHPRLN